MELSQTTINVLKNFHGINPSLMFRKGNVLKTISPRETIFAKVVIRERFEKDFAIYDLGKLLGAISLFESPEVLIDNHHIIIQKAGDSTRQIRLTFASEHTIKTIPRDMSPSRGDEIAVFDLPHETFNQALKTASVLGLSELEFKNDGTQILLNGISTRDMTSDTFSYVIAPATETQFNVVISVEVLKLIPTDYKVTIYKPKKVQGQLVGTIVEFTAPNINYAIGYEVKKTSFGS